MKALPQFEKLSKLPSRKLTLEILLKYNYLFYFEHRYGADMEKRAKLKSDYLGQSLARN